MKTFKNRFLFNCNYFLLWIVYFVVARLFFLLFYFEKTEELGLSTTLKTFIYGLRLDISFASYLCFIPFVLIIFSVFTRSKKIESILKWYSIILIIVLSLLLMIDASLYQSWGTRLDAAFLKYLNTPKLMIASVTNFQLISGVIFWILISFFFIKILREKLQKELKYLKKHIGCNQLYFY